MKNIIKFPSRFEIINEVEKIIDDITQKYNINSDIYGNILVSVIEAINNAIIHGNKLDESKTVTFEYGVENGEFWFSVKDEGEGFNYKDLPDPTSIENIEKPYGRGIFLITHLVDEYRFEDNGSKIFAKIKINLN